MDKKIRIVLADDHAVVRAGIRQFLEQDNAFEIVAEAEDGALAQELISFHKPDVVVLDIQMPNASGIEITRWLRAKQFEIGVLILTAYDDDPYVMAVLKAGANGYVLKTAPPREIIQSVKDVFEGKLALGSSIATKVMAHMSGQHPSSHEFESLTERELEVLSLTAKGYTNKSIGLHLDISDRTVQGHLANIYRKMQAKSRTEAVMRAVSLGLIPTEGRLNDF